LPKEKTAKTCDRAQQKKQRDMDTDRCTQINLNFKTGKHIQWWRERNQWFKKGTFQRGGTQTGLDFRAECRNHRGGGGMAEGGEKKWGSGTR